MEGGDIRCWDQLIPDVLGLIFSKLSLEEKLTVIPRICKSWKKAMMAPYCWQEINIDKWCRHHIRDGRYDELLDRMLHMLITRSSESLRKLFVSNIFNDAIFSFIADHVGSLKTLQMPRSRISDSIVEQAAGRMCAINFLDLSYCYNIGARALEAIGKNCRLLLGLRRNMRSPDSVSHDDEAHAIATTMVELKYLDIAFMNITTEGVLDILSGCQKLVFLDVRGCLDVELDDKFLNEKCSGLKVRREYYCSFDIPEIPEMVLEDEYLPEEQIDNTPVLGFYNYFPVEQIDYMPEFGGLADEYLPIDHINYIHELVGLDDEYLPYDHIDYNPEADLDENLPDEQIEYIPEVDLDDEYFSDEYCISGICLDDEYLPDDHLDSIPEGWDD